MAPLFTENFDYQFFYPDFVNGLLTSDLLGKTICCTLLEASSSDPARTPAWAAYVTNTKSYDAVSRAVLARRAYPLAPDENMPDRAERYEQRRARVYYGKDVDLSRCVSPLLPFSPVPTQPDRPLTPRSTCKISSTSLIGASCAIGPNTFITHSVLGPNVRTGSSCHVSGSYVLAGAQLGDGCVVRDSVIGEGAVIAPGSVVEGGAIIAAGVKLGKGARLEGNRVSLEEYEGEVHAGQATRACSRSRSRPVRSHY